ESLVLYHERYERLRKVHHAQCCGRHVLRGLWSNFARRSRYNQLAGVQESKVSWQGFPKSLQRHRPGHVCRRESRAGGQAWEGSTALVGFWGGDEKGVIARACAT